ncbi:hypothetical protein BaRGS_00030384 [Batillaria attramentaria]|uniref:C2H2-type domain-containing protein n=1 Tax=Batillaria attramentaria TaxID=370345 RepID=A0ABD0JUQ5_9CAEN
MQHKVPAVRLETFLQPESIRFRQFYTVFPCFTATVVATICRFPSDRHNEAAAVAMMQCVQFPLCHHHQLQHSLPNKMTTHAQQQKPLRHSIDAILEKPSPSTSPCSDHNTTRSIPVAPLPPFDVLAHAQRESARHVTSVISESPTNVENIMVDAEDSSSGNDAESGEDQEDDLIVVDEAEDNVTRTLRNCKEVYEADEKPDCIEGMSEESSSDSDHNSTGSDLVSAATAADGFAQRGKVSKTSPNTGENVTKVRSAFRPIVRPWLVGEAAKNSPAASVVKVPHSLQPPQIQTAFRTASNKHVAFNGRPAPTSLDAISMLRRQSSAFRACGNRLNIGQGHVNIGQGHVNASGSRMMMPGPGLGQPMNGNLAAWFSWLRAGHHLGAAHQVQQQQLQPGQGVPRGVLAPPNAPPPHHNPQPQQAPRYNCEACGKSYSTFGGLSKHKQFHCSAQVKKDFRCKFCDKSYSSLGALKMHIRTHTLPCKCTVCGKAFSRPWLLQGHVRTHTGEKPFTCPHCARAFADRSNLRAHLQTHSDVKKYCCRACSKTFSRMSLLVKHRESSCVALQR